MHRLLAILLLQCSASPVACTWTTTGARLDSPPLLAVRPTHSVVTPPTTQYSVGEASISAEKSLQRRYAVREACAQSCWPCSAVAALLRWQCRQASPTLAGNASHALLAQLCADGTATVARDAD